MLPIVASFLLKGAFYILNSLKSFKLPFHSHLHKHILFVCLFISISQTGTDLVTGKVKTIKLNIFYFYKLFPKKETELFAKKKTN